MLILVFFKRKTAYEFRISDWSSDVCSSDLGRYGDAIGAGRFHPAWRRRCLCDCGIIGLAVERAQIFERDPLDVAADAALGEAERHPRLEALDHPRLYVGEIGRAHV